MKELSIEQKAKRYDEAKIKGSRLWECGEITRANYEYMFPELIESGDEKIRKNIKIALMSMEDNLADFYSTHHTSQKELLSWLEKQSTPQVRNGLEYVNTIDDACDKRYSEEYAHGEYCHEQSFKWGFQEGVDWIEKQGQTFTKKDVDDAYLKGVCDTKQELEKQGEQKTVVFIPKFRDGDIVKSKSQPMLSPRKIISIGKYCYWCEDRGCIGFAWEDDYEIVEQKPAWSEEDSVILGLCVDAVSGYYNENSKEKIKSWLYSIKDRVQPQPKQEWSEKDKQQLEDIIVFVSGYADKRVVDKWVDWLKSLRLQNHWKPSDLQMKALLSKLPVVKGGGDKVQDILESLYDDLKKLKE